MKQPKKPEWILKAIRNAKARKSYFMKRYGTLERMDEIEAKRLAYRSDVSMAMELEDCD